MTLREMRELAALTQGELALAAGLSRQEVNAIETGRIAPRAPTIRKIAAALNAPVPDVVRAIRESGEQGKLAA